MSQRPQPVTSKFRNYYMNDIYQTYVFSESSSAGSTSSLTSVLYHDSFKDKSDDSDWIESEKIEENHIEVSKNIEPISGLYCKRIIARQPQYPGNRVTLTKYDDRAQNSNILFQANSNNKIQSAAKRQIGKSYAEKSLISNPVKISEKGSQKVCVRKIACKSHNDSEKSHNIKSAGPCSKESKSENTYSIDEFSSVSGISSKLSDENIIENDICPSVEENLSLSPGSQTKETVDTTSTNKKSQKIMTAWETWYLKKEKQKRKKEEIKMLKEKEKEDKEKEDKSKRIETCHEKIKTWLIAKENVHKTEIKAMKRKTENEKRLKEQKKEEMMKKSSEKYVEWKLEKHKKEKELEKQEKEMKIKLEAEEMIKKAKAANAFKRWFEEHKDHQMPVPYSYGISDGKLTSYYDKTSNPPPSFFNPDPWKPVIDAKN